MNQEDIKQLLHDFKNNDIDISEALNALRSIPFTQLPQSRIDLHRQIRCGYSEVIYCPGKTIEQIKMIATSLLENGHDLLATRASLQIYEEIKKIIPEAKYSEEGRIVHFNHKKTDKQPGIVIAAAGTSDIAVAEEARITAEWMGQSVEALYDVGVAGIHRLLNNVQELQQASVIIVVAGMEGALASVVGGLVSCPVVAVPTSVGYGASFQGLSALLTMLNSCAPGVVTVNIDNGFGAGYTSSLINSNRNRILTTELSQKAAT